METRANYALIGLFTLVVVLGAFGFVYWFQNLGTGGERAFYRVLFDGSVSGLRTGGAVLFNGIRIGEVTDLKLQPDRPEAVVATISVDKSAPVRADTKIGLEFQGLTGIAALSMSGGTLTAPPLAGPRENPPLLNADPDASRDVTAAARDTLKRLDSFVADNQEAFHKALVNIETFTEALARNSARVDNILAGAENLIGGQDGKSGEIAAAVRSIKEFTDTGKVQITNVGREISGAGREVNNLTGDARRTLGEIDRAVKNLDRNPSRLIFGGSGQSVPEYRGR